MYAIVWLIPALPLAGFLLLVFLGRRMPRAVAAVVGVGSVGLAALATVLVGASFLSAPPAGGAIEERLFGWVSLPSLSFAFGFRVDALTLTMMAVITIVGFLIHLYSSEFMSRDGEFWLFFAYMNLFVSSMLVLVMADNLALLYLGWEGVGLCSYFLIGFWYREPEYCVAARKAFIVTRIGDVSMLLGLALLVSSFATLDIQELLRRAAAGWAPGSALPVVATLLLLGGAVGKSAQLPLQVWLPDAMAGPTPVSALIHAATMVTAGVYLIARLSALYALAPAVQSLVAIVGLATLLLAGLAAIAQVDLKRILAYSTISQIGYMFLGLGVGFYSAAMFHFMVHAFFKALLFLAAGVVIMAQGEEHNIFRMGGLRTALPAVFWTFLIGASSLAALPLVTAGFYSKEWILWGAWQAGRGGPLLWLLGGCLGVLLTSLYSFRAVFVTFFGDQKIRESHLPGARMKIPLVILAALSILGGFIQIPSDIAPVSLFESFIGGVFPKAPGAAEGGSTQILLQVVASALSLIGVLAAYVLYRRGVGAHERLADSDAYRGVRRFLFSGLGFDWVYKWAFVKTFDCAAKLLKGEVVGRAADAIGSANAAIGRALGALQSGRIRWYLVGIALGAVAAVGAAVWL